MEKMTGYLLFWEFVIIIFFFKCLWWLFCWPALQDHEGTELEEICSGGKVNLLMNF